ncbi:hypothetical protein RBU61_12125 [Tissierella sp. MB52-C2]|uniref:Uncharacterized protein n=1 Tax=Tissierella pigra TaxID=2607614 RepID=A0A6N7Y0E3_9FIRM|nr:MULTISPECIES: hypothetical protein [Tissierella]MSU03213.1 hypothetical protein [Tissierella pigra]WMM23670.1 hypothetical protein RBU61_12125 [Tissierella sp. MB52-C2]
MNNRTVTLADIITKRNQSKNDKMQVKYYKSEVLDTEIEIRKIPLQRYMELSERLAEDNINTIDTMNEIIYECCPIFKTNTQEAMEAYGVAEPIDLPSAVLEDQLNEIKDIIEVINSFYGLDKIKDDEVKN